MWCLGDSEMKRRKRVASSKDYSVEGMPNIKSCISPIVRKTIARVLQSNPIPEPIIRKKLAIVFSKEKSLTSPKMREFKEMISGSGIPSNTYSARLGFIKLKYMMIHEEPTKGSAKNPLMIERS